MKLSAMTLRELILRTGSDSHLMIFDFWNGQILNCSDVILFLSSLFIYCHDRKNSVMQVDMIK